MERVNLNCMRDIALSITTIVGILIGYVHSSARDIYNIAADCMWHVA